MEEADLLEDLGGGMSLMMMMIAANPFGPLLATEMVHQTDLKTYLQGVMESTRYVE